jgi:hypothetical protein
MAPPSGRSFRRLSMDDYAVEAVVFKNQQAGKQLYEKCHRPSVPPWCLDSSIIGQTAFATDISNNF